jgi:hypothetical protein
MRVMVKRDSASIIPIDCGEGEAGQARLKKLVETHGAASITLEDGSPLPEPGGVQPDPNPPAAEPAAAKPKRKRAKQ